MSEKAKRIGLIVAVLVGLSVGLIARFKFGVGVSNPTVAVILIVLIVAILIAAFLPAKQK